MDNKDSVLETLQAEAEEANLALEMYRMMIDESAELEDETGGDSAKDDYHVTNELKERCLGRIRSIRKKQRWGKTGKKVIKILNTVAVCTLIIILVSTVLITSVEALRVPVYNFLIENMGDHYSLAFVESSEIKAAPTWIPEGYKLTSASSTGTKEYENGSGGYISFSYDDLSATIDVDNEGDTELVNVSGRSVLVSARDDEIFAIWVIEEKEIACTLCLYGESLDTATKIIENVK